MVAQSNLLSDRRSSANAHAAVPGLVPQVLIRRGRANILSAVGSYMDITDYSAVLEAWVSCPSRTF